MANQPNLSREGFQKLEFVGRQGDQLVYHGPNQKVIMLDVQTVNRLGTPSRPRKRSNPARNSEEDVWSGHRSSDKTQDKLATAKLIDILKNYQDNGELFTNKKMRKKEVWVEIASQLMAEGFHFRNKESAWEKVSQKWRNMERTYRMHVQNIRNKGLAPGAATMEFFDDLHELLAGKYNTESMLISDSSSGFDTSYPNQNDGDDTQHSAEMTNEELLEYYYEEQLQREDSNVTSEAGPPHMDAELCDTYVEDELPPSPTFSDNKDLVFSSSDQEISISRDPHTAGVKDPVLRLLLEMRAQERAHFREDRRERLKMQRDIFDFHRDLIHLLNQHHQERMEVMHNLIAAIGGASTVKQTNNVIPNGDHKDDVSLPLSSSRHNHLS
ncbi:Uncharacterized protein APZ42_017352 [Daphnia magna]|nr:hypothetical protein OUZ56_015715 [Daphnia magna]KZS16748.1 Uncharacterized protein APZ42_017352 [Daphnia magna]